MSEQELPEAVRRLIARQEIEDVLARYSRGVDRADIELLRSCYHEDATENHGGVFTGTAVQYIDRIAGILPRVGILNHLVTNVLIEFHDDSLARVESYVLTFARMKKDGEQFDTLTLARTLDRFERRAGRWAIGRRELRWEWNHEMPFNESWGRGLMTNDASKLLRGAKRPDDVLYRDL